MLWLLEDDVSMKGGKDELDERGDPVEPLFRVKTVPVSPVPVFSAAIRLDFFNFLQKNIMSYRK